MSNYVKLNGKYKASNQYLVKMIEKYINDPYLRDTIIKPKVEVNSSSDIQNLLKTVLQKVKVFLDSRLHPEIYSKSDLDKINNTNKETTFKYITKQKNDPTIIETVIDNVKEVYENVKGKYNDVQVDVNEFLNSAQIPVPKSRVNTIIEK